MPMFGEESLHTHDGCISGCATVEMRRFGRVAQHLGECHKLPSVVVWGNECEENSAREIVAASSGHAMLAPATDLTTLAAFINNGRLFASGDTGPLHLAVAVRTPSIALHGVTRPENSGPYMAHRTLPSTF